ncbi:MAG: hypothetical protein A3G75_16660, partial [Verrucomicrobia bacterium RIFCSPLOWO2_12_FULL_64_8]
IRLDLLLIFYRGISYRARRDDLQLIVLGLFLVVVAGVLTVSLAFAVQIVVFTACALTFLLVITLTEAAQGGAAPRLAAPNVAPSWVAHLSWRRLLHRVRAVIDWRVVLLGGALFAGLVVVSGLLFLAIPRFQLENSLFLERFISKKARTGFSESIRFGDVSDITQDNDLAINIDVSDPRQMPATPYLRMLVLDEYVPGEGFRLSAALRRAAFNPEITRAQLRGTARGRLSGQTWTFYFEPGVSRYLPHPGAFELLRFREAQNLRFSEALQVLALRLEPATMTAYRVENPAPSAVLSDPFFAGRRQRPGTNVALLNTVMGLPADENDRAALGRMAAVITGGENLAAREFARRAGEWLGGRHRYSLQSRLPAGRGDPLVRWLESDVPGHCEFFAGAFALLARAAGHPARLVVGFKGGSWNVYSNNLSFRSRDAHAWIEIWDGQGAWVRVDPTPGAASLVGDTEPAGATALDRRADRSWSARIDSLRVFWYRRIVNFDQRDQVDAIRALRTATAATGVRVRETFDRALRSLQAWLARPWDVRRVLAWAAGAAAAAALIGLWRRHGLAWWWRLCGPRHRSGVDPVRREAGRWLRKLVESRGSKGEGREVRADLERLRYGPRGTWPDPLPVFRRARQAVRSAARG